MPKEDGFDWRRAPLVFQCPEQQEAIAAALQVLRFCEQRLGLDADQTLQVMHHARQLAETRRNARRGSNQSARRNS